ncbi:MAG: methyl-accepting chemotaxis protein [Planctomycetota bacterium]
MNTRTKLIALTALAGLTTAAVGGFGYLSISHVTNDASEIVNESILSPMREVNQDRSRIDVATVELLNADRDAYQAVLALAVGMNGTGLDSVEADFRENSKQVTDRVAVAVESAGPFTPEGFPERFGTAYDAWMQAANPILDEILAGNTVVNAEYEAMIERFSEVRGLIDEFSEADEAKLKVLSATALELHESATKDAEELVAGARSRQGLMAGTAVMSVLVLAGLAAPLVLSITRRLGRLSVAMNEIATGKADLNARINDGGSDEIAGLAQSFDQVVDRLQGFVDRVRGVASSLGSSTETVSSVATQTSDRVSDQNGSVRCVSAAVVEYSASIDEVAANCERASGAATEAKATSANGRDVIRSTIESISNAKATFETGVQSVEKLGEGVSQITSLISIINDIADQTNLLALNAAIEAARAGEHGRGFAVVADEVRKLADRTTSATEEIVGSIREIEMMTKTSVEQLETGRINMNDGADRVAHAGEALVEIENATETLAQQIEDIKNATREQASATSEIGQQTESMTSTAEAIEADTAGLREQVNGLVTAQAELEDLVATFGSDAAKP